MNHITWKFVACSFSPYINIFFLEVFWASKTQRHPGWCLPLLEIILINLLRMLSFKKIGLTFLVEFGKNTLASLVYSDILVVANNMRSLGAQAEDGRRWLASLVYFIQPEGAANWIIHYCLPTAFLNISYDWLGPEWHNTQANQVYLYQTLRAKQAWYFSMLNERIQLISVYWGTMQDT